MKIRAAQASSQWIADAARRVEGLFVDMMLKSMRAAFPQEGLLISAQTQLYTSLYDQQLVQDLTARGVGAGSGPVQTARRGRRFTADPCRSADIGLQRRQPAPAAAYTGAACRRRAGVPLGGVCRRAVGSERRHWRICCSHHHTGCAGRAR